MFYYAYINADNICEGVYAMPSEIPMPNYILITADEYNSQSVVGKRYDAASGTWEEPGYYYAVLNEYDICEEVITSSVVRSGADLIALSAIDSTLVGKIYNRDTLAFETVPDLVETIDNRIVEIGDVDLSDYALLNHIHANATTTTAGFMSAADKAKLDGISTAGGAAGADGKSAYQIALEHGFEGTETEWLASLHGADGINGTNGADGADGTTVVVGTTTTGEAGTNAAVTSSLSGNTLTLNFTIPKGADGEAGASGAEIAASEILTKLKTVDGQNSGLDADLLDGHNADYFATTAQLSGKADSTHTHSNYASSTHSHSEYASSSHSHSGYVSTSGGTISGELNVTSAIRANGQQAVFNSGSQVILGTNNLATTIACSSSSDVTVNGARMQIPSLLPRGGGSFQIGNSSSRFTGIYLTSNPNVSSDERLKENITSVNTQDLATFIDNIDIVNFEYKDDADKTVRLGVVAQQLIAAQPEIAKYIVEEGENGFYGVKTADLVFPLICAVQELNNRLRELESRN